MATYKKAISGFGLRFLGLLSSYLFTYLVTINYGVENWGNFTFTLTITSFLVLFVKFGFDLTLLKFSTKFIATDNKSAIWSFYLKFTKPLFLIGVLLSLGLFFGSDVIANYIMNKPNVEPFLRIGSFAIIPLAFAIINAEGIRSFEKSNIYIFIQFVGLYFFACLFFLFGTYILKSSCDQMVIIAFSLSCLVIFGISLFFLYRLSYTQNAIELTNEIPSYKDILKVTFPFFNTNLLIVLIDWTDIFLLGIFVSAHEFGEYHLTYKISNLMLLPIMVTATIMGPKVASFFELKEKIKLQNEVKTSVKMTLILGALTYIGLIVGWPIINYVFDNQVSDMFWIFVILISGQFLTSVLGPNDTFLQLTGNEKTFQKIMIYAAAFNIIFNIIFIPIWGIWAACMVNLSTKLIWNLYGYYVFRKRVILSD